MASFFQSTPHVECGISSIFNNENTHRIPP